MLRIKLLPLMLFLVALLLEACRTSVVFFVVVYLTTTTCFQQVYCWCYLYKMSICFYCSQWILWRKFKKIHCQWMICVRIQDNMLWFFFFFKGWVLEDSSRTISLLRALNSQRCCCSQSCRPAEPESVGEQRVNISAWLEALVVSVWVVGWGCLCVCVCGVRVRVCVWGVGVSR